MAVLTPGVFISPFISGELTMLMSLLGLANNDNHTPSKEWCERLKEMLEYTPDAIDIEQSQFQNLFVCDDFMIGRRDHHFIEDNAMPLFRNAITKHNFTMFKRKLGKDSFIIPFEGWAKGLFTPNTLRGGNRDLTLRHVDTKVTTFETEEGLAYELERVYKESPVKNLVKQQTRIPGRFYAPVKGEVLAVLSTKFAKTLDKLKENGKVFIRKRIPVIISGTKEFTDHKNKAKIREHYQEKIKCWMYVGVPDYWNDLIDGGYSFSEIKPFKPPFHDKRFYDYKQINSE